MVISKKSCTFAPQIYEKFVKPPKKTTEKMKEICKKVSMVDSEAFKTMAMERLGWTYDQYQNRRSGRTEITQAERLVLEEIVDQINAKED